MFVLLQVTFVFSLDFALLPLRTKGVVLPFSALSSASCLVFRMI